MEYQCHVTAVITTDKDSAEKHGGWVKDIILSEKFQH